MRKNKIGPFIKWAGGKTQLLNEISEFMPKKYKNYYEPFVGGGAVLFYLAPQKAYINDHNKELVNTYKTLRDNYDEVINKLKYHELKNSKEHFYEMRSLDREENFQELSDVERAARFIYLNKSGFNGLYRVNKKGQFNVPYANRQNINLISPNLLDTTEYLRKNEIHITNNDFQEAVKTAIKGDFVYFDPPYIPVNDSSNFTAYTEVGFTLDDQIRLRDVALKLSKKGVFVMISNSDTKQTDELYKNSVFNIHKVSARRSINSKSKGRGPVKEVIITTYETK